jgi:outer membrane biosynthesis protein TonB
MLRTILSICGSILIMIAIAAGFMLSASFMGDKVRARLPALTERVMGPVMGAEALWSRFHFVRPFVIDPVPEPQPRPVVSVVEAAPVVVLAAQKPPAPAVKPVDEHKPKPKHHEKHKRN